MKYLALVPTPAPTTAAGKSLLFLEDFEIVYF